MTSKILQFIGKGQITIPREWKALLGIKGKTVKASLYGDKIIIEKISSGDEKTWNIKHITLNTLSPADQKLIRKGRKSYKKGEKNKFMTASEFFGK